MPRDSSSFKVDYVGNPKDAEKIRQRTISESEIIFMDLELQYSHVPLSNFELDWLIHTADVFFARALRDQQQIHHLAVNALLKSNQINEMEGGTLFRFDHDLTSGSHLPNEQLGLDDATSCAHAFLVLKQLIQRCLADAVSSGNIFADAMLQHLYRWLCR
ncbi:hypothetical protein L2E82_08123 [Cichorium intybus]|uniref:Uncharacterized protein n=1 Tax=Cichorium intybus TaxID=13427 RepID=A0ACB9G5Q9_CICIN|nr:hypothetical protein L2E82_08123 [Cichorium intybus]